MHFPCSRHLFWSTLGSLSTCFQRPARLSGVNKSIPLRVGKIKNQNATKSTLNILRTVKTLYLMHAHDLIVEFIIAGGCGQEGVSIGDEQVEDIHDLQNSVYFEPKTLRDLLIKQRKAIKTKLQMTRYNEN